MTITDGYFPNSVAHPTAPGDELFNRNDPTFHHYDVRGKLCNVGQPNCNLVAANSYSYRGLRAFTYPSYKLQPTYTAVDGSEITVYVTPYYRPWSADNPAAFTWPFGVITQRMVQAGYWMEGVQNVTTPQHFVYPGTITRKIFQEGNSLYVRTHGMGVNRFWCIPEALPTPPQNAAVRGVRVVIATSNDYFGAMTFKTLDGEMRKAWRVQNGYPAAAAGASITAGSSPENGDQMKISRTPSQTTQ